MSDENKYRLAFERERKARKEAEALLEKKSHDLWESGQKLEALLRDSEDRYSTLVETVSDIIFSISISGKFQYVNLPGAKRMGYEPEELIGSSFLHLVREDYRDPTLDFYKVQYENGRESTYFEFPVVTKSGKEFWVGQRVNAVVKNGKTTGYFAVARDISDRKNVEDQLRRSEEKYRTIIHNMELGLLEVSVLNRIVSADDRFCQITGYKQEELLGKNPDEVFFPGGMDSVMEEQKKLRAQGERGAYEIKIYPKKREAKWLLVSGAPWLDDTNRSLGSIGIHMDITDQKKVEAELFQQKTKAEQLGRAKETFLANVSHEIRTPINAILGMARLISKSKLGDKESEYLEAIIDSGNNLAVIINDILDFSKIRAGELSIEQIDFDLNDVLQKSTRAFQFKAVENGLYFELDIDPKVKRIYNGDPVRINQILNNLISNALKFTSTGGVKVSVTKVDHRHEADRIRFSVKDTGIGIEGTRANEIFQPFKQENESVNRRFGGTGLGLSICAQLVEIMDGRIWLETEVGNGSNFSFEITVHHGEKEPEMAVPEKTLEVGELSYVKVLVAEDNKYNQILARTVLEDVVQEVDVVENGEEAVRACLQGAYDVVLMDIQMPILDGIKATHLLREQKYEVPIIALTANALKGDRERFMEAGMDDYISKPFEVDDLLSKIATHVLGEKAEVIIPDDLEVEEVPEVPNTELYSLDFLDKLAGGNKDHVKRMVVSFLEHTPTIVDDLQSRAADKQYEEMGSLAHRLKASCRSLYVKSLVTPLEVCENRQNEYSQDEVDDAVPVIVETLQKVIASLRLQFS